MSTMLTGRLWKGAVLGVVLGATLAVFLALTVPPEVAGQSGHPAKPTGLEVTTTDGSLAVSVDWNDVSGATSYLVRWRPAGSGHALNDGAAVTVSNAVITVAETGRWVVRVEACDAEDRCGRGTTQSFEVKPAPEPTPTPCH